MTLNTLRNLVSSLFLAARTHRRDRTRRAAAERLESRTLLAGNVLVQLQNGNATITGDDAANQFEITGGLNSIRVRGLEGTTINGGTAEFTLASASAFNGNLRIELAAGNDRLAIGADVTLAGVQIFGGDGDDNLSITTSTLRGNLVVNAGLGSNTVTLLNAQIQGHAAIDSAGPALVNLKDGRLDGRLEVSTGTGDDQVSADGTTIAGRLSVTVSSGNDVVALRGATLANGLYVDAGRGDDVVFIDNTNAARRSEIWMRQGNDSLKIQGNSSFGRRLLVGAVLGSDRVEIAPTVSVSRLAKLGRPATTVDAAVIDAKVTSTTTGALGKNAAAVDQLAPLLTVDVTPDTVAENASAPAASATITRSGSTASALTVTLTSSATSRATVPATVTIPAGALTASANVTAVDNSTAEPDATVTITAAASGYKTGSDQLVVTGQESPALSLAPPTSTPANTIPEAADATARTFTISRNTTDLSQPLTVSLTAATPARLTVPASVQIPANSASATFTVDVQNNLDDGDVSVQVTAAATGLTSATSTVSVVDDDNSAALAVTADATSVPENSTSGLQLTITRNGVPTTDPLTVNLLSNNPRLTIPATVTIPAGSTSTTVAATPVNDAFDDNDALAQITASATAFTSGTLSLNVVEDDIATLTLSPTATTFAENASTTARTFTIRRLNARTTDALSVTLSTGLQTRLTAPNSIEIPAAQDSAEFILNATDNQLFDATIDVQLTAAANGFTNAQSTITLTDDESSLLSISPASGTLAENASAPTILNVTRNTTDVSQPLTVLLASNSTRLSVPTSVVIPAGQGSVNVSASAVQNDVLDGTASVTITASATGFGQGTTIISVTDDDLPALTLTPAANSVSENSGNLSTVVSIGKTTSTDRTVVLNYSNVQLLSGPASVTIPAGQSSATVSLTVENGPVVDGSLTAQVSATTNGSAPANAQITITDADTMALTASGDTNSVVASNSTLITKLAPFTITGNTTGLAFVQLDTNGDGIFDTSTTADSAGNYSLTTTLTNTAANKGANRLVLRATFGPLSADTALNVHYAKGTVIRFETTSGTFDAELLNTDAPVTVANFRNYESSNAWQNLIVHRNVPDFVIQGGGFTVSNSVISSVTTNPPITNEFNPANSNLRGTIAMALAGGNINSGTSQWFVNVVDNTFLDDGKYTVFGRVIGNGMQVVDAINDIPSRNISTLYGNSALNEVPLDNSPPTGSQISGLVSAQSGSSIVLGSGTNFTSELQVGQALRIGTRLYFVGSIQSSTQVTLTTPAAATSSNSTAFRNAAPPDADFVIFSNISELLADI
jgi:cyclophilin family peptidyl-prolyl cis-trans isomerase